MLGGSWGFQTQILISMFLGIFCGLFFGEKTIAFDGLGQAYLMLLKMTILPYLSVSLIHGVGSLSLPGCRLLLKKGLGFLLLFWATIISSVYLLTFAFPKMDGPRFYSKSITIADQGNLLSLFIPVNPFSILGNDTIPAVVLFSLLFGIALMQLKNKGNLLGALETIVSALMSIVQWVSKLAPIGVFALVVTAAGTITVQEFEKIWVYILIYIFGAFFLSFLVLPCLVASLTAVTYREFFRSISSSVVLAFASGNVLIVLPFIVESLKNISARHKMSMNESRNTIETLIPVFYNLPTAGNLLITLFVLFLSAFYSHTPGVQEHLDMIFSGIISFLRSGGASIYPLTVMLDKMHLPHDGVSLYLETVPFTRHFQAMVTAVGIATISLLVHFSCQSLLRIKGRYILKRLLIAGGVLILGIISIRSLPESVKQEQEVFTGLVLKETVEHTVYTEEPPFEEFSQVDEQHDVFQRIKETGVIRVGYNVRPMPFAYLNKAKELVGYDIAFAHKLAQELQCRLEFIPFQYSDLSRSLDNGLFDIAMSGISVSESRLKEMRFTEPYMEEERAFIVKDYQRHSFELLDEISGVKEFKLAVLRGSIFESLAKNLFPHAELVRVDSYEEFMVLGDEVDALLWTKEQGTTWALIHPEYTVVVPTPSLGKDYLAYAVGQKSYDLLHFVNYWLDMKKLDGFSDEQYQYWILGEPPSREPRWSILRNVLHWEE
jgi:Na+/H+-dicarboxylate symporter/ABC-type amino acid transport substrate-binding protein